MASLLVRGCAIATPDLAVLLTRTYLPPTKWLIFANQQTFSSLKIRNSTQTIFTGPVSAAFLGKIKLQKYKL
jgi:hypothetical protein